MPPNSPKKAWLRWRIFTGKHWGILSRAKGTSASLSLLGLHCACRSLATNYWKASRLSKRSDCICWPKLLPANGTPKRARQHPQGDNVSGAGISAERMRQDEGTWSMLGMGERPPRSSIRLRRVKEARFRRDWATVSAIMTTFWHQPIRHNPTHTRAGAREALPLQPTKLGQNHALTKLRGARRLARLFPMGSIKN
jgi:hypothetical protein